MNKPTRPRIANPSDAKAWLQHAQAELASPNKNRSRRSGLDLRKKDPWQKRDHYGLILPLVFGLVLIQAVALIVVFVVVAPPESQPTDVMAALDVSSVVEQSPALAEPPPPPAASTPQSQDIFEQYTTHLPTPVPVIEAPVSTQAAGLRLRGVEITQGIQVFQEPENPQCQPDSAHPDNIFCNNSMPMVADRHTLVRAYLACNGNCPATETVIHLRLLKDGQEQASLTRQIPAETVQRVSNLSMSELRLSLDNSTNFEFFPPPAWLSGQITFEVEVKAQAEPNSALAQLSLIKDFAVRKPLRIAYLPIAYQGLRPPEPIDVDYWLRRLYPVPDVEYYRLPVPDVVWDGDVSKGEVLRKLVYTYWFYAQYNPAKPRPDQLFGWMPQELYNGGASDPFWCPNCAGPHSSRVAFGGLRPEQDIGGPRILAHEIAHNLGAQHAWSPTNQEDAGCFKAEGVDIQVDPDWPYSQTPYIQEVGIDLYSNPPVIHPPQIYDMMAYCTQPWISPHTYRKLFDSPFLKPDTSSFLSFPDFEPQVEANEGGTLLVSGVVYPDGTVSRPEIIKLAGDAFGNAASGFTPALKFTPPPGDDYCLDVQASDDTLLAQHCFDIGFTDLETGSHTEPSPFFLTLPQVNTADVGKVTIRRNRVAIIIVTPSNNPPDVTVTYPNGGEVLSGRQTLSWDAHDADGDSLQYDVLYSPDGGQNWLPLAVRLAGTSYTFYTGQILPSENALIRVIANDGFNTTIDESDGPFTIQPPPENSISLVGSPTVQPGQTFEIDVVANRVTEPGLFGVQFELAFDPNLIQVDNIQARSALDLVINDSINNDTGQVSFVASRKGRISNLVGHITLATLTLTAVQSEGQVYLDLYDVIAGARGGIPLNISDIQDTSLQILE